MSRGRVVVVLVAGLVLMGLFRQPIESARADTRAGVASNGCVRSWDTWQGSTTGWEAFEAAFHLRISSSEYTAVVGAWYVGGTLFSSSTWANLDGGGNVRNPMDFYQQASGFGSRTFVGGLVDGQTAIYRLSIPNYYPSGCFTVDQVTITRWVRIAAQTAPPPSGATAPPTATPGATPCYGDDVADCGTPPPGECWVADGFGSYGQVWYATPCQTAVPTATWATAPPLACGSTTIPVQAAGTWSVSGNGTWCRVVNIAMGGSAVSYGFSGSMTLGANTGSGTSETRHEMIICTWGVNASDAVVNGGCINANRWFPGSTTFTQSHTAYGGSVPNMCVGGTAPVRCVVDVHFYRCAWPFGLPTFSYTSPGMAGNGCNTGRPAEPASWSGTVVIGSGAPTPAPTNCDGAPDWYCTPPPWWNTITPPPSWGAVTPAPLPPDGDSVVHVDVCEPGTIASTKSLCQTWPPDGSGPQSSFAGGGYPGMSSPDVGGPDTGQLGIALDELGDTAVTRVPFSWAAEVASALDPASYAGAPLDWCMHGVFGQEICVDPTEVSGPITGFRTVLLGLLLVLLAWAIARRVWATLGGTPGSGDA